jgi:TPR repeat protein
MTLPAGRLAADAGLASAQCNLARMYELGRGVGVSCDQAAAWYKRAADARNRLAQEALRRLQDADNAGPAKI